MFVFNVMVLVVGAIFSSRAVLSCFQRLRESQDMRPVLEQVRVRVVQ